ncbi:MAG: methyl-accepting chemotaxis protein, partial [Glaciecola sp.]
MFLFENKKLTQALEQLNACQVSEKELSFTVAAIQRAVPFITFMPDGTILDANEQFLQLFDYRLDEIKGKHHRVLCDDTYVRSSEYKDFWQNLNSGVAKHGHFPRITASSQKVWLEASYFPVIDDNGHVVKIIKIANDITDIHNQ